MIDDILEDKWVITRKIGKGTFSRLFIADCLLSEEDTDVGTGTLSSPDIVSSYNGPLTLKDIATVAVKVQPRSTTSVLRWESEVLKALSGIQGVPRFYCFGTYTNENSYTPASLNSSTDSGVGSEKYDYIIMEHLKGEDMSRLRDRIRARAGYIALPVALFLIQQMLTCVQQVHEVGYVHRDIKPANFVRRNLDSTDFILVDFGLSKLHRDDKGIRQQREDVGFRGTRVYASPHAHNKDDLCPRDDLYSVLIVLIDLWCGELPWSEANRNKDYETITTMKQHYLLDNPTSFADWIEGAVVRNCAGKDILCDQFPPGVKICIIGVLEYLLVGGVCSVWICGNELLQKLIRFFFCCADADLLLQPRL
jgi:serine/threonine protein kinase